MYCLQVYGHYSDVPFKRLALLGLYIISPLNAIVCVPKYRKLHSASWTSLVRRRHWETEHLPSPDRVSGTAFLLPSVIRHCRRQSSEKFCIFCIKITRFWCTLTPFWSNFITGWICTTPEMWCCCWGILKKTAPLPNQNNRSAPAMLSTWRRGRNFLLLVRWGCANMLADGYELRFCSIPRRHLGAKWVKLIRSPCWAACLFAQKVSLKEIRQLPVWHL